MGTHKPRDIARLSGHDRESNLARAYADCVSISVSIKRLGYRMAFRVLQLIWLVRKPVTDGVKCIMTEGDRILLVRHTYGNRRWDFPGGAMKRHEQPLAAAQREMREELGVTSAEWSKLGEVRKNVNHRRDTVHCFRAELSSPELSLNAAELATAEWFHPEQLPRKLAPYVAPVLEHFPGTPAG
jgi:8-oxo-dGTP pyrophosphatase MutT (NUDIX family)